MAHQALVLAGEPADLLLIRRALGSENFGEIELLVCGSAEEAVLTLSAREEQNLPGGERLPLFALLDFDSCAPESLRLLERLEAHPRFRFIPVVLYARAPDWDAVARALGHGARCCVPSADKEAFVRRVRAMGRYWRVLNWPELWTVPRDMRTLSRLLVHRRRVAQGRCDEALPEPGLA